MLSDQHLKEIIKRLMDENHIVGYNKKAKTEYNYTKPAKEKYPFQYFWDSCFHAFILVSLGEVNRAKKHLRYLFRVQHKNGFMGNIIYWKHVFPARITDYFQMQFSEIRKLRAPHMSSIIQPTLFAQAILNIYNADKDIGFVVEMLPKLKKYFDWLYDNRNFDGDGLLNIITTFESGMDWKASYDAVLGLKRMKANLNLFFKVILVDFRNFINNYNLKKIADKAYFRVKDVGFNSIYIKDLEALTALCNLAGDPDEKKYADRENQAVKSMLKVFYDEEDQAFYDVYGKDNIKIKILTPTVFFPIILKGIDREIDKKVLDRHFFNEKQFWTKYPLPSLAVDDPAFNPKASKYIWRGPTWIIFNWLLHKYLIDFGHNEAAHNLIKSVLDLIELSGFREYYNPFTGEGYGATGFTWSALVLDMIQNDMERETKTTE